MKNFRLKLSLIYLLIFIVIFFICRIALYIVCQNYFSKLSLTDFLSSLIIGLRFDIFAICTFCGGFLFLINLPINSKIYLKINSIFLNMFILIFSLLLVSDIIYFKLFLKHFTTELLLAKNHISYFCSLAFGKYLFVTLSIILITILLFYFSLKIINKYYTKPNTNIIYNSISILIITFLIVVSCRGGLQTRILSISDAYKTGRIAGELKLNGIFTSLISIRSKTSSNEININLQKAISIVQQNLVENDEEIFNKDYPLMRSRKMFNVDGKNYNVVVILLESWQKDYIDSLSGSNYGITPNFDNLVKNSLVFDKFYANGQRSIMGLMSVFLSFPYVAGLPYLGNGLENSGQTKLPLILKENGYDNVFVQGDKRESDNAIAFANYLGFKNSYGKEDIPLFNKYDIEISKGYDIEGFEFFFNKINLLKKPFFAFYFTTTTHIPYSKTILKKIEKYLEDGTEKTGYLNRLYYADYALGLFFKKAQQQLWFEDTIFIMCADHQAYGVGGQNGTFEKTKVDKTFKIPMIIYCPKLFKHKIVKDVGSQLDIIPTIIDILNIKTPYSSLGKSLFSKTNNRFVFLSYEGEQVYLVKNNNVVECDWKTKDSSKLNIKDKSIELMLSIEKTVYNLISKNKWNNQN